MREQRRGQEDHRSHAAVRGPGVHRDAESVPCGEYADDGEAELRRVVEPGHVHQVAAGQQPGRALDRPAVHADTGVVDDHAGTVVRRLDGDLDGGVGL